MSGIYLQDNAGQLVKKEAVSASGEGGRVAYVVFSQSEELDHVLVMCAGGEGVRCDIGRTGVGKWCEEYASGRPVPSTLDTTASLIVGEH